MKKYIFSIVCIFSSFIGYAYDFEVNFGDQYNPLWMKFDWVEKNETCQLAAGSDDMHGVNTFRWKSPGEIPSYVEHGGKPIKVIGIGDYSFAGAQQLQTENLILPPTLEYIGKGAFANNTQGQMQVVLDLKNLKSIGDYAFYNATWFKGGFTFENIDYIGDYAFANCTQLTGITIKNTKEIGDHAFFGVRSATSIVLENVEKIGDYAFTDFEGTGVCGQGAGGQSGGTNLVTLNLGEHVTHIGNYAFAKCYNLEEINIPNSVTHIGDYAFYQCQSACTIIFGNSVKYIGNWAFDGRAVGECSNTDPNIELPSTLTELGSHAFTFNNERGFTDLFINASKAPKLIIDEDGCSAFGYYDPSRLNETFFNDPAGWIYAFVCLHVPQGSYDEYKNADGWENFQCIIDDIIPVNKPVEEIESVGYAFIVPSEEVDLKDIINVDERWRIYKWEVVDGEDYIELTDSEKGIVKGKDFGQAVVVAYDQSNEKFNGNTMAPDDQIVGCVVVFVCPTVTMIYDSKVDEKIIQPYSVRSFADEEVDEGEKVFENNATYEHRVVYNSLPKFEILPADNVKIESIDHIADGLSSTDDITKITSSDFVSVETSGAANLVDDKNRLVPTEPITNNRVILASIAPIALTSGVESVDVNSEISVNVSNNHVSVIGANPDDVLTIYNVNGQVVYRSKTKSVEIHKSGVYVATVGDAAFKIAVN